MKLKCPQCRQAVSWSEARCPQCHASTTLWAHLGGFLGRFTLIVCPNCRKDVSWRRKSCPACGQAMTIDAAFKRGDGAGRLRTTVAGADDQARKKFQRSFVVLSALLFCVLMAVNLAVKVSYKHYFLLLTFLPLIALLAITITPYPMRMALIHRTAWLFRIGIVINVFSFVLGLKLLIGFFENPATVIAVLIGVMLLSGYLLIHLLAPVWFWLEWFVHRPGFVPQHDPQADQGHKVKVDHG